MFRSHKLILTIFMITVLTACGPGQAAEPTATVVDIGMLKTAAVATAQTFMTLNAPTITATFTITLPPSETSTQAATNTPGGIVVEATPNFTPTETPFGAATAIPSFTPISGGGSGGNPNEPLCKNAGYDGDVTVPDGTVFEPWEKFTKIWSIRNTGTCTWDEGFYFAAVSGPSSMGSGQGPYKFRTEKDFIGPGEAVNMTIEMYAPGEPGDYVAHWHMYDDNGKAFGSDFTVVIKVVK